MCKNLIFIYLGLVFLVKKTPVKVASKLIFLFS